MAFWNRRPAPASVSVAPLETAAATSTAAVVKATAPTPATTKMVSGVPAPLFDRAITGTQYIMGGWGDSYYTAGMWASMRDPTSMSLVSAIISMWSDTIVPLDFAVQAKTDKMRRDEGPMLDLLRHPGNGWTSGELKTAWLDGLIGCGNAYMLFESSRSLKVLDWRCVRPPDITQANYCYTDPWTNRLSYYDPMEIIHLRWKRGMDGVIGIGPLWGTATGELATDYLAQKYTMAMLANMGVAGILLSPLFESSDISPDEAEAAAAAIGNTTAHGGQGNAVVLSKPFRVDEMKGVGSVADTRQLRWVAEERICSTCRMHPALLGIGTGSEQSRVGATQDAIINFFWSTCVLPMMRKLSEQLGEQLLWRFHDPRRFELTPNVDHAPVVRRMLADTLKREADNALALYHGGLMGWADANIMIGGEGKKPADLTDNPTYGGAKPGVASGDRTESSRGSTAIAQGDSA